MHMIHIHDVEWSTLPIIVISTHASESNVIFLMHPSSFLYNSHSHYIPTHPFMILPRDPDQNKQLARGLQWQPILIKQTATSITATWGATMTAEMKRIYYDGYRDSRFEERIYYEGYRDSRDEEERVCLQHDLMIKTRGKSGILKTETTTTWATKRWRGRK